MFNKAVDEALDGFLKLAVKVIQVIAQIVGWVISFLFRYGADTLQMKREHDRMQTQEAHLRAMPRPGDALGGPTTSAGARVCPECGEENPANQDRCFECFTKLSQKDAVKGATGQLQSYISEAGLLICPECGEENALSKQQCYICHTPLIPKGIAGGVVYPSLSRSSDETIPSSATDTSMHPLALGCLVLIVGMALFFISGLWTTSDNSDPFGVAFMLQCLGCLLMPLGIFSGFYLMRRNMEQ